MSGTCQHIELQYVRQADKCILCDNEYAVCCGKQLTQVEAA